MRERVGVRWQAFARLGRWIGPAIATLLVAACVSNTFPSPQGPATATPEAAAPALLAGVRSLCTASGAGADARHLAFVIGDDVALCFEAPLVGYARSRANPGLSFGQACVRPMVGGYRGDSGDLIFNVHLGNRGPAPDLALAVAELEVGGEVLTAKPAVTNRPYLDLPPGHMVDGQMRYDVEGESLDFAHAAPRFTREGLELAFTFHRRCDPNAVYTLKVSGVSIGGTPLEVPAVEFGPHKASVAILD